MTNWSVTSAAVKYDGLVFTKYQENANFTAGRSFHPAFSSEKLVVSYDATSSGYDSFGRNGTILS